MTVAIGVITEKGVSLLADRRMTLNSTIGTMQKIHQAGKWHFAIAGYAAAIEPIREALEKCDRPQELRSRVKFDDWTLNQAAGSPDSIDVNLLITDGETLWMTSGDLVPHVVDERAAVGSGGDAAMGALLAGAGPEESILIAAQVDARCGSGCDRVDVTKRRRGAHR